MSHSQIVAKNASRDLDLHKPQLIEHFINNINSVKIRHFFLIKYGTQQILAENPQKAKIYILWLFEMNLSLINTTGGPHADRGPCVWDPDLQQLKCK